MDAQNQQTQKFNGIVTFHDNTGKPWIEVGNVYVDGTKFHEGDKVEITITVKKSS